MVVGSPLLIIYGNFHHASRRVGLFDPCWPLANVSLPPGSAVRRVGRRLLWLGARLSLAMVRLENNVVSGSVHEKSSFLRGEEKAGGRKRRRRDNGTG